jgi:hypothetical protein
MELSLLALQIAIIFLPGLIWARLDATYGLKSRPSDTEFFMRAFMFGLVSYAVTFVAFALVGRPFKVLDFAAQGNAPLVTSAIAYEIIAATGASFLLAVLWLYITNYKLLTRFLQAIGATKTYGDEDVWDFTFNSQKAAVEYVHFRDFANRLVYAGWVNTFSETERLRELVLSKARLYDFDGNLLFETPLLYLARNPENVHVEFPYRGESE